MKIQAIEFNSEPETQEARNGVYVFDGKGNQYRICLDQFGDLEVYASDGRIILNRK